MHVRPDFGRLLQHLYLFQHLFPALGTPDGFLAVEGAELFYNLLLMLDFALLVQVRVHGGNAQLLLLLGVISIVSRKAGGFGLVDFDDLCGDPVQKIPVVGDDNDGALIIRQVGLQPCDGVHVKMVGRLVQYDQIRLLQQELAQSHPGLLAP